MIICLYQTNLSKTITIKKNITKVQKDFNKMIVIQVVKEGRITVFKTCKFVLHLNMLTFQKRLILSSE